MTILTLALLACIVAMARSANGRPATSPPPDGDTSPLACRRRSVHQKAAIACSLAAVLVGAAFDLGWLTDRERIDIVVVPALAVVVGLDLMALAMLGTSKPQAERSIPALVLPVLAALLAFGLISCGGIVLLVMQSH